jgi:hypothetical protein
MRSLYPMSSSGGTRGPPFRGGWIRYLGDPGHKPFGHRVPDCCDKIRRVNRNRVDGFASVALKLAGIAAVLLTLSFSGCKDRGAIAVSIDSVRPDIDSSTPARSEIECYLRVTNNTSEAVTFNSVKTDFIIDKNGVIGTTLDTFAPLSLPGGQSKTVQIRSGGGFGIFALYPEDNPRVHVTLLNNDAIVYTSTELPLPMSGPR